MNEKLMITSYANRMISILYMDNKPAEIHVENHSLIGDIHLARVSSVVPSIEAAFLEIMAENEKIQAFYSLKDNPVHNFADQKEHTRLIEGDEIVVQIKKDAIKTKAPIANAQLELGGQLAVLSTGQGKIFFSAKIKDSVWKQEMELALRALQETKGDFFFRVNCLIRTSAFTDGYTAEQIFHEVNMLQAQLLELLNTSMYKKAPMLLQKSEPKYLTLCKKYKPKVVLTDHSEVFARVQALGISEIVPKQYTDADITLDKLYSVQALLDNLLQKKVWMKSGAYLVIEYTEALTVIDVNSGKINLNKEPEEVRVRVNMEAASCAMEQIRLRNLSGIILIDFIDMKRENRKKLFEKLEELAKLDRIKTNIVDFTALGLVEITRQRNARPLYEEMG